MIDARRMEVFTAIYDSGLHEWMAPAALILEPNSFGNYLNKREMLFLGSGSEKWKSIIPYGKGLFFSPPALAPYLSKIAIQKFQRGEFTDITYAEPVYIKEFHTHVKK
jgi:tRNA threonylcarbamoyladenosine biosynthesis protein TsaB